MIRSFVLCAGGQPGLAHTYALHNTQPVDKNATQKLDFTWFEYPVERFEEVVGAYMEFWEDFKARHGGFEPTGKTVCG